MGEIPGLKLQRSAHLTNLETMRKLIICVPDEMAALVREWKKWIPEMTIVQEETCDDQPKRVKRERMGKVENTGAHREIYMSNTEDLYEQYGEVRYPHRTYI